MKIINLQIKTPPAVLYGPVSPDDCGYLAFTATRPIPLRQMRDVLDELQETLTKINENNKFI